MEWLIEERRASSASQNTDIGNMLAQCHSVHWKLVAVQREAGAYLKQGPNVSFCLSVTFCVYCQNAQEVVSGRTVADVCGLAVDHMVDLVLRCVAEDVAVQIILPSGTKDNVSLLTSARVRRQHSYYRVFTVWVLCVSQDTKIKICGRESSRMVFLLTSKTKKKQ